MWKVKDGTKYEAHGSVFFTFQHTVANAQQTFNIIAVTLLWTIF